MWSLYIKLLIYERGRMALLKTVRRGGWGETVNN